MLPAIEAIPVPRESHVTSREGRSDARGALSRDTLTALDLFGFAV